MRQRLRWRSHGESSVDPAGSRGGTHPRLSIGFILAHRFTLCAFGNFVDVLRLAADEGDRSRPILCDWTVLSDTMNPVVSSCGRAGSADRAARRSDKFNYIVVVGGLIDEIPIWPDYTRYLQRAAASKVPLVGVCTGAFILQRAKLMDGYRCCVSWFHHADFLEQFDGITPVSDQIFIVDGDRLTCSGGTSSRIWPRIWWKSTSAARRPQRPAHHDHRRRVARGEAPTRHPA